MKQLGKQKCVPCEGGIPPMRPAAYRPLLKRVPGWKLAGNKLVREFKFADFVAAMKFVNKVPAIAEREGHPPDFAIHWNRVTLTLWTHAIGGLSQNDFIVAAKVNGI